MLNLVTFFFTMIFFQALDKYEIWVFKSWIKLGIRDLNNTFCASRMDVITSVLSADGTKKGIFVEVNEPFTGLNDSRFCSNRYSSRSYGEKIFQLIIPSKHQELEAKKADSCLYMLVGVCNFNSVTHTEHRSLLALHQNQLSWLVKWIHQYPTETCSDKKKKQQHKAMAVAPSLGKQINFNFAICQTHLYSF